MNTLRTAAGAALLAACFAATAATPRYTVTDLGTVAAWGVLSSGVDINDVGQVLGVAYMANSNQFGFVYDNGTLKSLDGFMGYSINDAGQLAGRDSSTGRPALYSNGTLTDITPAGGAYGWGNGINNLGQVVGLWSPAGAYQGFVYKPGSGSVDVGNLGAPGNDTVAGAINDAGQVVGLSNTLVGDTHAFLLQNGHMTDLGTLYGNNRSVATNISQNGLIVGNARVDFFHEHAFLYTGGEMMDLGVLNSSAPELGAGDSSYALDVNNAGQVVGYSWFQRGSRHAFLYSDGQLNDLNDLLVPASSNWTIVAAQAINERGDIAAYGCSATGGCTGLLLTAQAVPEPATWAFMLGGLGLAGLWAHRRQRM